MNIQKSNIQKHTKMKNIYRSRVEWWIEQNTRFEGELEDVGQKDTRM
jgi:hypothetical protein